MSTDHAGTIRQWTKAPRTTSVSNDVVDSLTSLAAKGLYVELRRMPEGSKIGCRHLATLFEEGRDKIARCLNQLIAVGVLTRVVWQVGNGRWITKYLVSDQVLETDDVLEIARQYGATYIAVSADLARPLRQLGLTYTVNDNGVEGVVRVSGFTASGLVRTGSGNPAPGWTEPMKPLVMTGSGFLASGEEDIDSTGCQKSGSHKEFTYSPYPSLPDEPPAATAGWMEDPTREQTPPTIKTSGTPDAADLDEVFDDHLEQQTNQVMAEVVKTFRAVLTPRELMSISMKVRSFLTEGQTVGALTAALTTNTGGIKMPGRVLLKRLADIPATESITREFHALSPSPAPWCGSCDQRTRLVNHDQVSHRCHTCHPARPPAGTCETCVGLDDLPTSEADGGSRKSRPWRELLADGRSHELEGVR